MILSISCAVDDSSIVAPRQNQDRLDGMANLSGEEYGGGVVGEIDPNDLSDYSKREQYERNISNKLSQYQAVALGGVVLAGAAVKKGLDYTHENITGPVIAEGARLQADEMERASSANAYKCPKCDGYGKIDPGGLSIRWNTCPRCDGTGWLRNGSPYKP